MRRKETDQARSHNWMLERVKNKSLATVSLVAEKSTWVTVPLTAVFVLPVNPVLGAGLMTADIIGGRLWRKQREKYEAKSRAKPLQRSTTGWLTSPI